MQNNPPVPFYKQWLQTSGFDELSLTDGVSSPNTGCFLAQQMEEKLLKALLAFANDDFPKTHDLPTLASRPTEKGFVLSKFLFWTIAKILKIPINK